MPSELQPLFSGWPSLDRFRRDMDELFDRFFGDVGHRRPNSSMTAWPAVESFFGDGNWVTRVDLPGVDPKDIDVAVAGDTLTIRASRERRRDERNQNFETREKSATAGSSARLPCPRVWRATGSKPAISTECWR
jgi:HSP20 family molecular chaperone IbpA